jgi:hypothetical protein
LPPSATTTRHRHQYHHTHERVYVKVLLPCFSSFFQMLTTLYNTATPIKPTYLHLFLF